jgi:hypothetical protein
VELGKRYAAGQQWFDTPAAEEMARPTVCGGAADDKAGGNDDPLRVASQRYRMQLCGKDTLNGGDGDDSLRAALTKIVIGLRNRRDTPLGDKWL